MNAFDDFVFDIALEVRDEISLSERGLDQLFYCLKEELLPLFFSVVPPRF